MRLLVTRHDAPITIRGKRYKKLLISAIDLWRDEESKQVYDHRCELMVFNQRSNNWVDLICIRSNTQFDLEAVLKDLIRGKYANPEPTHR